MDGPAPFSFAYFEAASPTCFAPSSVSECLTATWPLSMCSSASTIASAPTVMRETSVSLVFMFLSLLVNGFGFERTPHPVPLPIERGKGGRRPGEGFALVNLRKVEHVSAEQRINRVFLARLRFDEMRPILVGLGLAARCVLVPKLRRGLGVLNDESAIHDGPRQRIGGPYLADARRVTAVAPIRRRIL